MILEEVSEENKQEIKNWCDQRGFAYLGDMFPKIGLIANKDDRYIAAWFMYTDLDNKIAWLAWQVANPDSTQRERGTAFTKMYEMLAEVAKGLGIVFLVTNSHSTTEFGKKMEKLGFQPTDRDVTHYLKNLGE